MNAAEVDTAIAKLELEMQHLQSRHRELFAYANAWAERHDAIVSATPPELLASVERRLQRIGVRWGVAPGSRVTTQFPVIQFPVSKTSA